MRSKASHFSLPVFFRAVINNAFFFCVYCKISFDIQCVSVKINRIGDIDCQIAFDSNILFQNINVSFIDIRKVFGFIYVNIIFCQNEYGNRYDDSDYDGKHYQICPPVFFTENYKGIFFFRIAFL